MIHGTGVDIIDVKNVNEGSLGAQFPWCTREIVELTARYGVRTSATLGDLPFKPGTAALAAYGAAQVGVTYIKAGLYGLNTYDQACEMMDAVRKAVRMVSDTADVPDDYRGEVMLVNDHGNVTLYHAKVALEEVWAIV